MYIWSFLGFLLVFVSIQATAVAAQSCYFPSGDPAHGNVPCNNGTEFSSCCGSASSCLANGLCLVNTDEDTVEFGRGGCTDKSWKSPNCFPYCRVNFQEQLETNGAAVFECGSVGYSQPAFYCCEIGTDQKTSCCQDPSLRFQLGAGLPTGTQTMGSMDIYTSPVMSSLSTGTSSTSSTATTSTTTSSSSQQSAATGGGDLGSERLHGTASASNTNGPGISISQAAAGSQTSSPNSVPTGANSNETMIIVVGVTIPIFVLFTCLMVFLIWNNRRNSREIRLLKEGLRYGPSNASLSHVSSPIDYKSTGKALPNYPQSTWRSDYYRPNLRSEIGANSGAYELSHSLNPQELDSATSGDTASEDNQV